MKTSRDLQIFYLLINLKEVEISKVANIFNVSEKTVTRSIQNINNSISKLESYIILENHFLKLIGNADSILKEIQSTNEILSTFEKQVYMLNCLFNYDEKISLNSIAKEMELPILNVKKEFNLLTKKLEAYDCLVKNDIKNGIHLLNKSYDAFLGVLSDLIFEQISLRYVDLTIKDINFEKAFNSYIYRMIKTNIHLNLFSVFYKKLLVWKNKFKINLSEDEVIFISIKIIVWLNHDLNRRLLKKVLTSKVDVDNLFNEIYISKDKKIINGFLNVNNKSYSNIFYCHQVVKLLINEISKLFGNNLKISEELKTNMMNHLIRIKEYSQIAQSKDMVEYHLVDEIQKYISDYNEIWTLIKKVLNDNFSKINRQDKLTYELFIYVIVWFDSLIYDYISKIRVVCIGGMGQSTMMVMTLKKIYKNAIIIAESYGLMTNEKFTESDLVISTIEINEFQEKVLHISSMTLIANKDLIHKILAKRIYQKLTKEHKNE